MRVSRLALAMLSYFLGMLYHFLPYGTFLNDFEAIEDLILGRLAGAFLIDQAFFAYLQGKAKLKITSLKASEYNGFVLKERELCAKRNFSSIDEPEFYNLYPPSDAYGTMARILKKETMDISK
ncbi:uncharacterized protein FIESC28_00263 [Fusarium coffeatum]|uniref:Uncharacterized protein n=1 Tax=Fusarium coffeatum TaxID=231269 RepID=A0A366SEC9_9HYPO|nr:uncharacterized protein FIESC28_00263 [Fusarium coffeatum]RBR26995.1 hypothetical protein FIESC28_00263 [Fusarium coffeatum]